MAICKILYHFRAGLQCLGEEIFLLLFFHSRSRTQIVTCPTVNLCGFLEKANTGFEVAEI